MTIQLQVTTNFNVETTLNASFADAIAAFTLPTWLSTAPALVFVPSDIALNAPCYGVFHIPVESVDRYQGRRGDSANTTRDTALMEISAWVSSQNSPGWLAQLRTMVDLVKHWHNRNPQVGIKNYAANPSSPAATAYKINLAGITTNPIEQDVANPALWRARMLVSYSWHYRA